MSPSTIFNILTRSFDSSVSSSDRGGGSIRGGADTPNLPLLAPDVAAGAAAGAAAPKPTLRTFDHGLLGIPSRHPAHLEALLFIGIIGFLLYRLIRQRRTIREMKASGLLSENFDPLSIALDRWRFRSKRDLVDEEEEIIESLGGHHHHHHHHLLPTYDDHGHPLAVAVRVSSISRSSDVRPRRQSTIVSTRYVEMAELARRKLITKTCLRKRAEGVTMGRYGVKGSKGSHGEGEKSVTWGDGGRQVGEDVVEEDDRMGLEEVIFVDVFDWELDYEDDDLDQDSSSSSSSTGEADEDEDDNDSDESSSSSSSSLGNESPKEQMTQRFKSLKNNEPPMTRPKLEKRVSFP